MPATVERVTESPASTSTDPETRAALVVNTASRRGREAYDHVRERLLALGVPLTDCFPVTDASRLVEVVEHLVADGHRLVVVGGGDGTISSVVGAIAGTDTVLGVLPLGTANDLARTLEIPADLDAACAAVAGGRVVDIDVGRVGATSFLNVASIGLSVEVTRSLRPGLKRHLGPLAYPVAAVPAYLRHRPFTAELHFPAGDHEPLRLDGLLQVAIGNGRFYGGGNAISPGAGIDDHSLDVYAIPHGHLRQHLDIFRFFRTGHFTEHDDVLHLTTRAVELRTDPELPINVDGEVITSTPETFTVDANALDVIVPAGSTAARLDRERRAVRD